MSILSIKSFLRFCVPILAYECTRSVFLVQVQASSTIVRKIEDGIYTK
jgi:hypothetical protein